MHKLCQCVYVCYNLLLQCLLQLYKFEKRSIPESNEEKEELCTALSHYGISLKQYRTGLKTPVKRPILETPQPRKSPRLSPSKQETSDSSAKRNLFHS